MFNSIWFRQQTKQLIKMKPKITWNKRTFIRWKVYIDRARMYIGYINFFMIGFVFLKSYKDTHWGAYFFEHLFYTLPLLLLVFFLFSLIIGYIDSKMGFREEEMRNSSASNPVMMEILKTVKTLEKELEIKQK